MNLQARTKSAEEEIACIVQHQFNTENEYETLVAATTARYEHYSSSGFVRKVIHSILLAQTRLFTSKDITANTRRKYRKLPEIRQKKIAEKEIKIRKNNRKLANIFNKVCGLAAKSCGELIRCFISRFTESAAPCSHRKNGLIEQHDHYLISSNADSSSIQVL